MSRTVHCAKLGQQLPGLDHPPMPGPLGARIWREISQEAWKAWLGHATMLINENRLNPSQPEARAVLYREMEKFLFTGGAQKPAGYVPPEDT